MQPDRIIRLVLRVAAISLSSVSVPVLAQEVTVPAGAPAQSAATGPAPMTTDEVARFERFLDQHPVIEARLRENPDIARNPAFQKNHPLFAGFLNQHPEISAELAARPRWFIHRELVRQSAAPVTRAQVAEFDRFLDQHPALEKQLAQHPNMLRAPDFLGAHPELQDYLRQHPGINRASESKPGRLMERERIRERAENIKGKP
jgi:hypothetical protein